VLPVRNRLTRGRDFSAAVRRGPGTTRAAGRLLVVHLAIAPASEPGPAAAEAPARVGFVVSRAVGSAVVRNRTVRRLRHLVRERLDRLPADSMMVVRAQPAAADASSAALGAALDASLRRLLPVSS
jgi:ribonuclease P protein component